MKQNEKVPLEENSETLRCRKARSTHCVLSAFAPHLTLALESSSRELNCTKVEYLQMIVVLLHSLVDIVVFARLMKLYLETPERKSR